MSVAAVAGGGLRGGLGPALPGRPAALLALGDHLGEDEHRDLSLAAGPPAARGGAHPNTTAAMAPRIQLEKR